MFPLQAVHVGPGRAERADLRNADHAGKEIHGSGGQRLRVLDVVIYDEEDESRFVRLLQVEAA